MLVVVYPSVLLEFFLLRAGVIFAIKKIPVLKSESGFFLFPHLWLTAVSLRLAIPVYPYDQLGLSAAWGHSREARLKGQPHHSQLCAPPWAHFLMSLNLFL